MSFTTYRDDGWVYTDDVPIRKWHSSFENIRIWEPKYENLVYLYNLWRRTQNALNDSWKDTVVVMSQIWDGKSEAFAHVKPTYHLGLPGNISYFGSKDVWWEFNIHSYEGKGPTLGWKWLEERPKKLKNPNQGELLYKLDRRRESLGIRAWKSRVIFYEAMRRALPKVKEYKIFTYKFSDDCFIFYTQPHNGYLKWIMFDNNYKMEVKRII